MVHGPPYHVWDCWGKDPRGMVYLPPVDFRGIWDYWVVWVEETVALVKVLQRCAVHPGMPPGVLCRAVQELCRCLNHVVERGDQFNLQMLDMAERDPKAPTLAKRAPSPTSETEEAAPSEGLSLVPIQRSLPLPGFTLLWANESDPPPLEDSEWPMTIPLGSPLDLTCLGSMEWMVSCYTAMGEMHLQCQTWVIAQMILQQTLPKSSDQPDPSPWIEELWANVTHFTWPTSDYAPPRLLGSDQKCVASSFMSMTCASKHNGASLIIKWPGVAQHLHVYLFFHQGHSVFIHCVLINLFRCTGHLFINFFWSTRQVFYMIIQQCHVPMHSLY